MTPSKLRIIIIDDEECIRDSLAFHLSDLGHEVLTYDKSRFCPAFNHHQCEVKGACADIVLVDHNMPEVTGLEHLKHLTRHGCQILPRNRILMTGDASPDLEKAVVKMGCKIIQKPLRLNELDALIEESRIFISAHRQLSKID